MQISVSTVIYNTPEEALGRLLRSLRADTVSKLVVIVDNSPRPTEPKVLREFPRVEYVQAGGNLGYGRGHNLGVRRINSKEYPYHLVVNPDVSWDEQVIAKLVNYMEANPDVALVMPRVVYPNGDLQYLCKLLPTPLDLLMRRFLPSPVASKWRAGEFDLRFTGYRHEMNVPYLSGCFMFLRRSAFDAVGGFDERFFMYPEDVDLTRRLHRRWRTMFHPSVKVVHVHAKASYKTGKMFLAHLWNMAKYFNKWGWLWDSERREVNRRTLAALRKMQAQTSAVTRE